MSTENKHTRQDLKEMQAWSLEQKIKTTQARILEWYQKWDGQVYVSFSGGKDSTVLLDLARRVAPDIEAVFVDTGLEYPEVRSFALATDNVTKLEPKMNFKQVVQTYGYPLISKEVSKNIYYYRKNPDGWAKQRFDDESEHAKKYGKRYSQSKWIFLRDSNIPISNRCCDIMKKLPAKSYEHKTGKKPIVGTMTVESAQRLTAWLQNGCNAFDGDRPLSAPMSFWTEQDVLQYLKKFSIDYASVYGDIVEDEHGNLATTGCDRTGCMFCGFGCHLEKEPNRFQRLKQTHPQIHQWIMKPVGDGGLGMKEVLEYIGVKTE